MNSFGLTRNMFIKKVELHRHDKANKIDCGQLIITGTPRFKQSPLIPCYWGCKAKGATIFLFFTSVFLAELMVRTSFP